MCESAFTSAFRVVTRAPIFPFDKFPNLSRIDNVRCPILFLHGTDDETISLWHGQAVCKAANEPKTAVWIEGGHHDDVAWVGSDDY